MAFLRSKFRAFAVVRVDRDSHEELHSRRCLHLGDSQIIFCLIQDQKRELILSRRALTDHQWLRIGPLLPGKAGDRGRSRTDNRLFVDAILWLVRGAPPWRDLPPEFGNWRTVLHVFGDGPLPVFGSVFSTRYAKTQISNTSYSTYSYY